MANVFPKYHLPQYSVLVLEDVELDPTRNSEEYTRMHYKKKRKSGKPYRRHNKKAGV